jgi:hypothetical protein
LWSFKHCKIRPPPGSTLAQNFCASFVQPARSTARAALSCAHAKGAACKIQKKNTNDSLFILLSPFLENHR